MGTLNKVSKSEFKARALEYLRRVESSGEELIVTDRGRAVIRISPHTDTDQDPRARLRGSVVRYDEPTEPIALGDWESLR